MVTRLLAFGIWLMACIPVSGAMNGAVNQKPEIDNREDNDRIESTDSVSVERMLEELVVEGFLTSKKTATGEIFRLSDNAKNSGDPYIALDEIPILNVNLASHSVTTRDGTTPLILVDGRQMNSGIDPIDPKYIESVEVIEVPNAKYLQLGYSKVLNIRLAPRPVYLYTELRTRHEVIPHSGFAMGRFEIGKSKFAVSGDLEGDYTVHNPTDYSFYQNMQNRVREQKGRNVARQLNWTGEVMLKWVPTKSDFFSWAVKGQQNSQRGYGSSEGSETYNLLTTQNNNDSQSLITRNNSKNNLSGVITGVYYDHTFRDESLLSIFGYYNYATGDKWQASEERIGTQTDVYEAGEKSTRNQYHLEIDYSTGEKPYGNIAVGYMLEQTHNKSFNMADLMADPLSINLFDNYLHATYSGITHRLQYMISGGVQYMNVKAAGVKNSFWRPRAGAGLTWNAPRGNSFRLSYTLTNEMPYTNYLACFNTSTDPWLRIEGNPFLTPYTKHRIDFKYSRSVFNRLMIDAGGGYYENRNMIDPWLRMENDVMISSWHNNGQWRSPRIKGGAFWAGWPVRGGVDAYYIWENFDNDGYKGRVALEGIVTAYLGKFIIQASCSWTNKTYTAIGYSRYLNPMTAGLILVWRPNPHIQVMTGMDYWCGVRRMETINHSSGYDSRHTFRYTGDSMKPFILFSWTLRRNDDEKIDSRMPMF